MTQTEYKTIKTDTHWLLVDLGDTGIEDKTNWYNDRLKHLHTWTHGCDKDCKKIIAAYPPLENCYEFETLPNTEDEVEKMALIAVPENWREDNGCNYPQQEWDINKQDRLMWIKGYKQAKSETMFSLEDIKNAIREGKNSIHFENDGSWWEDETVEECFIKDLTQPKQYEFIPILEEVNCSKYGCGNSECLGGCINTKQQPKVINGKIQGYFKEIK